MKTILAYDKQADMGYVTLQRKRFPRIVSTEDLNEEAPVMVDVNNKDAIHGFELTGNDAQKLERWLHKQKVLFKKEDVYCLRVTDDEIQSKESMLGVEFLFAGKDYTNFAGINIIDRNKYSSSFLDRFTIGAVR
ncbi:hypothetical protein [Sinobaca sp. H24]|uniref:hypothetical protein n=1 Tax=Sinobaca sp. H24 TaxID=2923376 RepID=UPI002079ABE6|nr:hypothetical protein [Sinobaca sp. H24]